MFKNFLKINTFCLLTGLLMCLFSCDGESPQLPDIIGDEDVGDAVESVLDILGVPGAIGDIADNVIDIIDDSTIQEHVDNFFDSKEEEEEEDSETTSESDSEEKADSEEEKTLGENIKEFFSNVEEPQGGYEPCDYLS